LIDPLKEDFLTTAINVDIHSAPIRKIKSNFPL
jgi:hypothetical protein